MEKLIQTDWHVHSALSDCGSPEATPEAIVAAAHQAGLRAIGITDHVTLPRHRDRPALTRKALPADLGGLQVYIGCEADTFAPDRFSIDREYAATLDYVVMAASHLYLPMVDKPAAMTPRTMAELIVRLTRAAIGSGLADIIAHPFGVPESPFTFQEIVGELKRDEVLSLGRAAAEAGVAIELNPRYYRRAPDAAGWLFGCLMETGVKFALDSDAHHPSGVGCRGPIYATEEELRAEGITPELLWSIEDRASYRPATSL